MARNKESTGIRSPGNPPADADTLDVAAHYLDFYLGDYSRARVVAKHRARFIVVTTAAANGAIALLGAITTLSELAWLGLFSVGITGIVAGLAAWDGLYRHRELWIQRSIIVSRLNVVQRDLQLRRAAGEDRSEIARQCMLALDQILSEDLTSWTEMRNVAPTRRTNTDDADA